ncbi:hypothetical protein AcW1_000467 [Taiwanofungus camphoratus]|nr:hypothetical protein AcW2_001039 [Antrodia cinnamomea]KAI0961376.1 hypothetical protein AcV7_000490 [Antrodia cinnamomea]KAI0963374.1 hypothetical protein AcW1_000467 [Antrodia cinnamomea]
MAAVLGLNNFEISSRPRKTWQQKLNAILGLLVFLFGSLMVTGSQFVLLLPLKLLPFASARRVYHEGIRYSKGAFGTLLVSFEREGSGRFTDEEVDELVEQDKTGRVVALHLPQRAVVIANHQIYADWWYTWSLMYFMNTHKDVYIVLKDNLKWIPVLGLGMQFFNFIFLKRSWASDRVHLSSSLSWLGRRAEKEDSPLTFILYPEGTLVSKDTRVLSKKFADKMGIPDMMQTLLPRSTGLHYSLRSLAPRVPDLQMIDITIAYPGISPTGYGQSYYTLRSIFLDRVPPPAIHMHIRRFDVAKEVPIGDTSTSNPRACLNDSNESQPIEVDIPEAEREIFELWLRDIWRQKDRLLIKYLDTGSLVDDAEAQVYIPLKLRHAYEVLDAFCFFMPAAVCWALLKLRR